jgi:hypothetical protein
MEQEITVALRAHARAGYKKTMEYLSVADHISGKK